MKGGSGMKLSEMDTCALAACLCRLAGPIERIGTCEAVERAMKTVSEHMDKGTNLERLSVIIGQLVPVLLGSRLDDTIDILSAMTGKTQEELLRQNGMQTIRDVTECIDGDLLRFFGLSDPPAQQA